MADKKKFYLTTAIAYTSGKPHIGNTYEVVLADSIVRFKRQQGYDVRFQTGTDEHGQKIELKAQEAGVTPKQFVDDVSGQIKTIWDLQGICQYFASGWNRDGLALRAAGDLIDFDPGPAARHLLILLTDASPNDSRRIPPSPDDPLGRDYGGSAGVEDAAAEVRALQRKGLRVSAVFMGEDASAADASRIYGKNMARIRGMDQLARAAGRLIQNEIRELGD